MKNIEWTLLIPIIAVILALVLAYFSQPKASRKVGKIHWDPEYYTGMLGGVGIGLIIAPAIITPAKNADITLVIFTAFGCIFVASCIRDNFLHRRARSDDQPEMAEQKYN
jgi:uncharacterized membrane protein